MIKTGVLIEADGKGAWNCFTVTGEATLLSPEWVRQLKATEPGFTEEWDKQMGKMKKVKGLVTRIAGTHVVRGESLAVAMNRARMWLTETVRIAMKPTARVAR